MVIFNNGQGGGTNQTADLELKNNGIYNYNGWEASGIESILGEQSLKIFTSNGILIIESPITTQVAITRADGASRIIPINPGWNYIDNLLHGFYIVNYGVNNAQKVIL